MYFLTSSIMEIINILLATIVAFLFSALYYSPKVFGEAWMNSLGYTHNDGNTSKKKRESSKATFMTMMIQTFIITFIQLTIVAFFIAAFQIINFSSVIIIVLLLWVMMTS